MERVDAAMFAFAALIGASHLSFPLGREHALAGYVARAWLAGTTPYRGTLSFDAPGLVWLHALLALFGERSAVPLRVAALLSVLAVGALAPLVVVPRGTPIAPGVRGLSACAASLFAHGYFDFWTSGRGGVFVAAALLGACAALLRDRHAVRGPLVAGALVGLALTLRTAAFPFVPLLLGVAFSGPPRRGVQRVGLVLAGGGVVVGLAVLPIAYGGGLAHAYDLLWDARCVFVGPPRWETFGALFFAANLWGSHEPLSSPLAFLFLAFALRAALQRDASRFGRAVFVAGFAVASVTSLAVVGSSDVAEEELLVGLAALVVVSVAQELALLFPQAPRRAHAAFLVQCIFLYAISCWEIWSPPAVYGLRWRALAWRVTGRLDERATLATFGNPAIGFFPTENADVAGWLRANTKPGDNVLVRGYEPGLYLLSGRTYAGRFFTTGPLVWNNCAYKRGAWLAQDQEDLARTRPRVVVTVAGASGLDGKESLLPLGYKERFRTPHLVVTARE
jgi:hypothetical protein